MSDVDDLLDDMVVEVEHIEQIEPALMGWESDPALDENPSIWYFAISIPSRAISASRPQQHQGLAHAMENLLSQARTAPADRPTTVSLLIDGVDQLRRFWRRPPHLTRSPSMPCCAN